MLYKFRNKKGNITIILIGIVFIMILMAIALTKRMSGHTQLLTLSDYTQINRYFLESYMGDVMQQMRVQANDSNSDLSKVLCSQDNNSGDITNKFKYTVSPTLRALSKKYTPNIIFEKAEYKPKVVLSAETHAIGYPVGIGSERKGVEKKGYIEITCKSEFNKRKYTLSVQYPFSVVYRMTPILKDFMLFVDRINRDQNDRKDDINVLRVGKDGYLPKEEQLLRKGNSLKSELKPLVLMQPLDDHYDDNRQSGKVYLGSSSSGGSNSFGSSSDYPVYINLTGSENYTMNETFLVSARDLGVNTDDELEEIPMFMDTSVTPYKSISLPGIYLPMYYDNQKGMMGIMGFSAEVTNVFGGGNNYHLEEFFPEDKCKELKPVRINNENYSEPLDLSEAMSYSSALRLMGLRRNDGFIVNREIYGNVLARFMIFSFWEPGSAEGVPLDYDLNQTNSGVQSRKTYASSYERPFKVLDEKTYQFYMSKIMSGIDINEDNDDFNRLDSETKKSFFMAMNIDHENRKHNTLNESHYNRNNTLDKKGDGFALKDENGNTSRFCQFGEKWFGISENSSDNFDEEDDFSEEDNANIEARIGRTFVNQEKFKEAVGYDDTKGTDQNQNFKINGVVYVKGDLDLRKGMILDYDEEKPSCSGGVVLVDGKITLGNIYRRSKLDTARFTTADGGEARTSFTNWNNSSDKKNFIPPDRIITFVCLKEPNKESRCIEVKGNVLLGVQLVNLSDPEGYDDQIVFNPNPENKEKGLVFYGSIACNSLNIITRLQEFGRLRVFDDAIKAPIFLYPPVMATSTPPLAVQINGNMKSYRLTSSASGANSGEGI